MKTIIKNTQYRIDFNGSSTYFFIDNNEDCHKTFSTERKALNYFNKVSKLTGAK